MFFLARLPGETLCVIKMNISGGGFDLRDRCMYLSKYLRHAENSSAHTKQHDNFLEYAHAKKKHLQKHPQKLHDAMKNNHARNFAMIYDEVCSASCAQGNTTEA